MQRTSNLLLSIFFCLFLLNGCSKDVEKEIVGVWRGEHRAFKFHPDNTFEQMDFSSESRFRGIYSISDGDQVRLRYNKHENIEVVHTAHISGNELTLTNREGRSTIMERKSSADK